MFTLYQNESFSKKHNVLLVAHSQGNLFGNKMYTLMSVAQKKKFRMISVGTPADHVAGDGPYITLYGDFVIRPIPNSLPANTNGSGHTFVGAYLGNADVRVMLSNYITSLYNNLSRTTSCTKYWAMYMHLYDDGVMKVYAVPENQNVGGELVANVQMHTYPAEIVEKKDKYGNTYTEAYCNKKLMPPDDLWDYVRPVSSSDEYLRWLPGNMYDKYTVEQRKNISYTLLSRRSPTCIDIRHDGQLYDVAIGIFEE